VHPPTEGAAPAPVPPGDSGGGGGVPSRSKSVRQIIFDYMFANGIRNLEEIPPALFSQYGITPDEYTHAKAEIEAILKGKPIPELLVLIDQHMKQGKLDIQNAQQYIAYYTQMGYDVWQVDNALLYAEQQAGVQDGDMSVSSAFSYNSSNL
jgi:hypothetical protein